VVTPTKRARALCFARSGRVTEDCVMFTAAAGLIAVRTRLQQIEHSDEGSAEELNEVQAALRALLAALRSRPLSVSRRRTAPGLPSTPW
jgi:hypothetical protein